MGQMRCGCEVAAEARKATDPRAKASELHAAKELQTLWGCPGVGGLEPQRPTTRNAREALEAVERVTGIGGFRTCPRWYAMQPGGIAAAEAYDWAREGGIEAGFGKDPPHALVQAVQLIRRAYNARREDDDERDKNK